MRAVLQRVSQASVTVDGEIVGEIDTGLLVLLGVTHSDGDAEVTWMARKVRDVRILRDEKSVGDLGAPVLVVSQFTLYGNCRKGRRPSFTEAAEPVLGNRLYEQFLSECARLGYAPQHGRFGADMQVASVNDGPVTLILDTDQLMDTPRR